jgi:hypothetical protein
VATHLHRFGIAVLLLSGLLGVLPLWDAPNPAVIEVQHREVMLVLLSATLFLSAFASKLRLPAIAASVLSKLGFIVVAVATTSGGEPISTQVWLEVLLTGALVAAGIVFAREAWQEARWNGMLRIRLES